MGEIGAAGGLAVKEVGATGRETEVGWAVGAAFGDIVGGLAEPTAVVVANGEAIAAETVTRG